MKRFLLVFSSLAASLIFLASASAAHARELCPPGFDSLCQIKIGDDAGGIIATVMIIFFIIAIITSLLFIVFGAFRWVTSAGDQNRTQQARSTIIAAVVGLIISISVFFIINIVLYVFTGQGIELLDVDFKL